MIVLKEEGQHPIKLWVGEKREPDYDYGLRFPDIEEGALRQLQNIAKLPIILPQGPAAMPDVHYGVGATVGSVIPTVKAIIPAAVGVDIGCGMMASRLAGATVNDVDEKKLKQIYSEIVHTVPTGFDRHDPGQHKFPKHMYAAGKWMFDKYPTMMRKRKDDAETVMSTQFGSLGGGNHFIELCVDENGELWLMLHSGSRGIGNQIGMFFINEAKELHAKLDSHLPDRDLAWFSEDTELFNDYVQAVTWAQLYAEKNREEMMRRIMIVLHRHLPPFREQEEAVNCHHNYVNYETHFGHPVWVTRKGAIRAGKGELGIIPGSMGAKSYIVRGKGNADSYESCSHGAGRQKGRKQAERELSKESLHEKMKGIVWLGDERVLDEHPDAYKDIDQVMANQTDLVEVVHTIKQILNVKGT